MMLLLMMEYKGSHRGASRGIPTGRVCPPIHLKDAFLIF